LGDKKNYSIDSKYADELNSCLTESILKYRRIIEIESDLYLLKSVNKVLDKFFLNSKLDIESSDDTWKSILNLEKSKTELFRLFSILSGTENKNNSDIIAKNVPIDASFLKNISKIVQFSNNEFNYFRTLLDWDKSGSFSFIDFIFSFVTLRKQQKNIQKKFEFKKNFNYI
jgi:hypothetical protein